MKNTLFSLIAVAATLFVGRSASAQLQYSENFGANVIQGLGPVGWCGHDAGGILMGGIFPARLFPSANPNPPNLNNAITVNNGDVSVEEAPAAGALTLIWTGERLTLRADFNQLAMQVNMLSPNDRVRFAVQLSTGQWYVSDPIHNDVTPAAWDLWVIPTGGGSLWRALQFNGTPATNSGVPLAIVGGPVALPAGDIIACGALFQGNAAGKAIDLYQIVK